MEITVGNINKISKRFTDAQNSLVLQSADLSLQSVSDMIDSGAIDISPKYQRRERWKLPEQSALIESFLLNIPIPPVYLAEEEYGRYSVIDGKQRLTAINYFLNGKIKLKELDRFVELEGMGFDELPDELHNSLKIRPYLRVVTLLRQSDPALKHEVFLRLNKAGIALNDQEIRNVAFSGELNDKFQELAKNAYLRKQFNITEGSKKFKEMDDVQCVLRFFALREYWNNFPGKMPTAFDNFMKENYKLPPQDIEVLSELYLDCLALCEEMWGQEGFRKPNGTKQGMLGFYDVHVVALGVLSQRERNVVRGKLREAKDALLQLYDSDLIYRESATSFLANSKNVQCRIGKTVDALRAL